MTTQIVTVLLHVALVVVGVVQIIQMQKPHPFSDERLALSAPKSPEPKPVDALASAPKRPWWKRLAG